MTVMTTNGAQWSHAKRWKHDRFQVKWKFMNETDSMAQSSVEMFLERNVLFCIVD